MNAFYTQALLKKMAKNVLQIFTNIPLMKINAQQCNICNNEIEQRQWPLDQL